MVSWHQAKLQAKASKQHSTPQPRNNKGKFDSIPLVFDSSALPPSNNDLNAVAKLVDNPDSTFDDKRASTLALHARWQYEDKEEQALEGEDLQARQRSRCKELGRIVFGFTLHDAQANAIYTLFHEKIDLLLLAKTGFGKSLIFQFLPFMTATTGVVFILMPLKLLQAEQSELINQIPQGKGIVLNGENNTRNVLAGIANGGYTHVSTSPESAPSKKFKSSVLDQSFFTDCLCLLAIELAIDEIHLVEEWGKNFQFMYTEIEKVRKRISCHVSLLGVSATLTKSIRLRVVEKAGFLPNYKLMQTPLDRPEIMQIHRFMEHPKSSCLDLQTILPHKAKKATDIQKTIIFVNSVSEIRVIISIFHSWMKKLGYPAESMGWIRPYHSAMSEWDKSLNANAFAVPADQNTEYTILVATDAYGMGINNPKVKLVIQWYIQLSFDSMISHLELVRCKRNWKAGLLHP